MIKLKNLLNQDKTSGWSKILSQVQELGFEDAYLAQMGKVWFPQINDNIYKINDLRELKNHHFGTIATKGLQALRGKQFIYIPDLNAGLIKAMDNKYLIFYDPGHWFDF